MGLEIERKFLVTDAWHPESPGVSIKQGYIAKSAELLVRVRTAGDRGFLTLKGRTEGVTRAEYEYAVPVRDAEELLALAGGPTIEKTRYRVPYAGHVLEFDVYPFWTDRAIMEIELESEDERADIPDYVRVLRDVTGEKAYKNKQLAKRVPMEPIDG